MSSNGSGAASHTPAGARVCIIRHYYYPEDPRSRREAEALAAAGHEVDILTLRQRGEAVREVVNGVNVRRLPVGHYRGSLFHYAYEYGAFFFLAFMVLTARLIRGKYDVVQVNSLPDFLVFAAASCKVFGVPVVLDMHECTPELFCTKYGVGASHPVVRILAWIEQRSLGFADRVITCTPQQRALFASRGTPQEKITVVLNAANSAIFRPKREEPLGWQVGERFELVAHGLVVERYGLDTMVRAVAILAEELPDVVLNVYGKGAYVPEMEALARELGVGERVIAHGFVPEEELLEGIARAHVGVIAAKRDTFRDMTHTQKMYEYVAMRKPVVIAETPAVRTHFDDTCFQFFTSDDATDLARALRELYHDPARALTMVEASSCRYRAYDWEAQRHIYSTAVLSTIPERRRRIPSGARTGHTPEPKNQHSAIRNPHSALEEPAIPVEATPLWAHTSALAVTTDWGSVVTPIDERGVYLGGIAKGVEESAI